MKLFVCILAACLVAGTVARPELGYAYAPPISTASQVATSYNPPASGSNYNSHNVQQQQQQHHHHHQQQQQLPAQTVAQTYQTAPVQQQQFTQTHSAPVQQQQQFTQTYSAPAQQQQQQFTQTYSAPAQQQQQYTQTYSAPAQQHTFSTQQTSQSFNTLPAVSNTGSNFLSGSSSHQYNTVNTHSVPTIVQKHIYVHVPPPDTEADQAAQLAQQQFVQPKKHYKIIFIKAPSQQSSLPSPVALAQAQAATEEKTIVYVLVKKPDEQSDYEAAASAIPSPPPSKPEVYFIKYKNQAVAAGGNLGVDVRSNFGAVAEQDLSGSGSTLTGFTGISAPVQQQQTIITTSSSSSSQSAGHNIAETLSTSQSQGSQQAVHVPAPVYGPVH